MTTPATTLGLTLPYSYGRGYQDKLSPASPAAGAAYTRVVPGEAFERVLAVVFRLVTSSTVAFRFVMWEALDNDGTVFARATANETISNGLTTDLSFSIGGPIQPLAAGFQSSSLPNLILYPGWQWRLRVGTIQAGDQLSAINAIIERWPNSVFGTEAGLQDELPEDVRVVG